MRILKARDFVKSGTSLILKDGVGVYFWDDIRIGEQTLRVRFPSLFRI